MSFQAQYSRSCPIISISCYNSSLVTWTVVWLTAAKFNPLIFQLGSPNCLQGNKIGTDHVQNNVRCRMLTVSAGMCSRHPATSLCNTVYSESTAAATGVFTEPLLRNSRCLQSHCLETDLHATILLSHLRLCLGSGLFPSGFLINGGLTVRDFSSPKLSDRLWVPLSLLVSVDDGSSFLGGKAFSMWSWPPQSSAEVKNACSCTSNISYVLMTCCLINLEDNFTLNFLIN
jgi:hypothetical protein